MRNRSRHILSILSSAVAHVVVLLTSMFDLTPDALDVDLDLEFELVEVDLVDLDMLQGEDKNAEPIEVPPKPTAPPPPELPPEPEAEKEKPEEKPEEPEGPKRDLGQKRSKVDQLGPPNSTYHVLLSTRNIKKLKYRDTAMSVMASLPDYKFIIKGGGFNPFKDFDHVLLASPDLRKEELTFIAVDYKISREAVKAKVEKAVAARGETIEWIDEGGILRGNPKPRKGEDIDTRFFVLLEKKVALYMREEFLPAVLRDEAGEGKTVANYITKLTKLKRYAKRIPTAGLQFEGKDLHAAFKRSSFSYGEDKKQVEFPTDVEFTVQAKADPEANLHLTFASVLAAKTFLKWAEEAKASVPILFRGMLDGIEITREGREITAWAQLEEGQTKFILQTIADTTSKFQAKQDKKRAARRRRLQEKAAKDKAAKESKKGTGAAEGAK